MSPRIVLSATAVAGILAASLVAGATAAEATPVGNCPDHQPVPGNADSLTVAAPAGQVITGYCVKSAGLKGTKGAPETVVLATPVTSIVLRHTDGGNLTHYSLVLKPATLPSPDPEPTPDPEPESTQNPPAIKNGSFDWDWAYEAPQCDGLVVAYPSNIPSGQANDVNIRLETDQGQVTLNYHLDQGTWSGTTAFVYSQHRLWPAGVSEYTVTWTQVGGSNYHWQGAVECALGEVSPETGTRNGYAVVRTPGTPATPGTGTGTDAPDVVEGYRTGRTKVSKGQRVGSDVVVVRGLEDGTVELQKKAKRGWKSIRTVTAKDGNAVVTYPKQRKKGTFSYRLAAGDYVSDVLTVKVR